MTEPTPNNTQRIFDFETDPVGSIPNRFSCDITGAFQVVEGQAKVGTRCLLVHRDKVIDAPFLTEINLLLNEIEVNSTISFWYKTASLTTLKFEYKLEGTGYTSNQLETSTEWQQAVISITRSGKYDFQWVASAFKNPVSFWIDCIEIDSVVSINTEHHGNGDNGDNTAPTRYVDFIFYYGDETKMEDPNIIFRTDSQPAIPINLELFNETTSDIILKKPNSNKVSSENSHFKLQFLHGVLSNPEGVTSVDGSGWQLSYSQGERYDQFYLLNTEGLTLNPTTSQVSNGVSISLDKLVANSTHTSPITNVTLLCQSLTQQSDTSLDGKSATNTIAVMSRPVNVSLPLEVGFISSNFVLNDGQTENELVLRILNHSNLKNSIGLHNDDSQFILTFDYSGSSVNWALMQNSNPIGDRVRVVLFNNSGIQQSDDWQATRNEDKWNIAPTSKNTAKELKAGYWLQVTIPGITTAYPSGTTNLYLSYQNLSYPGIIGNIDGEVILPIEKAPLLYSDGHLTLGGGTSSTTLTIRSAEITCLADQHQLLFSTNGSERMRIDGNGNVGIGTTNPGYKLEVKTDRYGIVHTSTAQTPVQLSTFVDSSGGWLGTYSNHNLHFYANNSSSLMTVTTDGNVGIGTTSPRAKLDVEGGMYLSGNVGIGTTNPGYKLEVKTDRYGIAHTSTDETPVQLSTFVDSSGGWLGTYSNHNLHFYTNKSSSLMTVTTDGNVGIGTTSPSAKLHINNAGEALRVENSGDVWIRFHNTRDSQDWEIGANSQGNGGLYFYNCTDGGSYKMMIGQNGNVGIGTTSPSTKLDVSGTVKMNSLQIGNVTIGESELSVLRRLANNQLNIYLRNVEFNCYAYGSNTYTHDSSRGYMFLWLDGGIVSNGEWCIELS